MDVMTVCPICKQNGRLTNLQEHHNAYGKFVLYECSECRGQFWDPLRSRGPGWYEERGSYGVYEAVVPKVSRAYHTQFLQRYQRSLQGKVVLDVGCGSGEFLAELQKQGAQVWGLDFDKTAAAAAQKHFNLRNIFTASVEEFSKRSDIPAFDIVTCFEVLQYAQDPRAFAQALKRVVKPSGTVFVSVPARERMLAMFDQWDFPPNHLTRWNGESIARLFSSCGFRVAAINHVESLRMLMGSVNGRFRLGLVKKSASGPKRQGGSFSKSLYILGRWKECILGLIPALILLAWSKASGRKNGTMVVECNVQESRT